MTGIRYSNVASFPGNNMSYCYRWIYFGSPYTNYLARIPKRLRTTSYQKSSAGVTLGLLDDPQPSEEL